MNKQLWVLIFASLALLAAASTSAQAGNIQKVKAPSEDLPLALAALPHPPSYAGGPNSYSYQSFNLGSWHYDVSYRYGLQSGWSVAEYRAYRISFHGKPLSHPASESTGAVMPNCIEPNIDNQGADADDRNVPGRVQQNGCIGGGGGHPQGKPPGPGDIPKPANPGTPGEKRTNLQN